MGGDVIGLFPSFIPKTDQVRYQNLRECDKEPHYSDCYEITVKMDGSSITIFKKDGEIGVCSRNFQLKEDYDNLYWKVAKSSSIIDFLENYQGNIAIQGELIGPGIQKNRSRCPNHRIMIFDVFDIDNQIYWTSDKRRNTFFHFLIDQVPIICSGTVVNPLMKEGHLKSYFDIIFPWFDQNEKNKLMVEGLVFKSQDDPSWSFKYINPNYLLKHDE